MMLRAAHAVYFLALAVWVGGLVALAFVAAPNAFKHAPSPAEAGRIFGPTLRSFGYVEMVCAALLLVSSVVLLVGDPRPQWAEYARVGLVGLMILLLFAYGFGINPAIAEERERVTGFDQLKEGDPGRARFDRLHRWSVRLVGANIVAGLALIVLSAAFVKSAR
jgi:uncharacterized membrane protein